MSTFRLLIALVTLLPSLVLPAAAHAATTATTSTVFAAPIVNVSCVGGRPYLDIAWTNPVGWPSLYLDISPNVIFGPLYHKVVYGTAQATGPAGFLAADGTSSLNLVNGTYYARLFNWSTSSVGTFTIKDCAPPLETAEPECQMKSIQSLPSTFESLEKSPTSNAYEGNQPDVNGIYQVYTSTTGTSDFKCITCAQVPGGPHIDRHKVLVNWHPSGQWLFVGVEEDTHDNTWMPKSWQLGFIQSGIWVNMWVTTPSGDRWYQLTDFKPANGPSNGYVGTPFTSDGKTAVWAEIVDGNVFLNSAGVWRLYSADFIVDATGKPSLVNKKDITPAGARWVEPANFAPDNRHLMLSADIGIADAQGQDQWSLDILTGAVKNLTSSPLVWDEHGLYSPNGKRISFMSSYPYRNGTDTYKVANLKTEIMLMDADGSHLQQLTHFNAPGYAESQQQFNTVAARATFIGDGSQLFVIVMGPSFSTTNWIVTLAGKCG